MTEEKGLQASPFKAEPIQNPKSKIQNRVTLQRLLPIFSTLLCLVIPTFTTKVNSLPTQNEVIFQAPEVDNKQGCPPPVLDRLIRHKVAVGETLESIASKYNLIPATLMGLNQGLRGGMAPVGAAILIPAYNGIAVEIPTGKTYRDVAKTYGVRPDVVFEINGCQPNPKVVFVPGVNWSPVRPGASSDRFLTGYPLPTGSSVGLGYGWQVHPLTGEVAFHSGIDLLANPGTPVLTVGDGVVAFASDRGNYGNLVVVNHQGGLQTRYAHLGNISVAVGQNIRKGQKLGTVGVTGKPDLKEPSLHFEVRYNSALGWVAEDPKLFISSTR